MFVKAVYLQFLLWFKIQMCSERMLLLTWDLIQNNWSVFDTVTSYHKMVMMSNSEYDLQLKQAIHKEEQVWDWKHRFLFMQKFQQLFQRTRCRWETQAETNNSWLQQRNNGHLNLQSKELILHLIPQINDTSSSNAPSHSSHSSESTSTR